MRAQTKFSTALGARVPRPSVGALAVLLVGVVACGFEPTFPEGEISCRTERDCPPSYECVSSTCYSRDLVRDGAVIDAPKVEAAAIPDAAADTPVGTAGAGGDGGSVEPADGAAGQTAGSGGGSGGASGGSGGASGCGTTCTLGAKRCGANGLESCIMVGTCPAFSGGAPCPGRQTCQGNVPNGACVCPMAPVGCTGKGTACAAMTARTCDVDTEGCVYEKATETCAAGKPCTGTFPAAACTCPAAPAACGGKVGTTCSGTAAVVTCALDANGCLAVTQTTPCAAAKPCATSGGLATCSCGAPPTECAAGAGGVCRANGQLATCAIGADGCLAVTGADACTGSLTCQGVAPNGGCKCPAAPATCGGGTGTFCDVNGKVVTCARDANNCLVITATTMCSAAQTCQGGAGAAACACPALPAACPGGAGKLCNAGGQLVTCVADAKGCVSVSSTAGCGAGLVCSGAFPSAACVCPTAPAGCGGTTGTFCSGNSTFSCSRDANNCLVATSNNPCGSGLVCAGPAGSASCQCPAAPSACSGASSGNVCQTSTTYVTCGKDGNGCVVVTSSTGTCPGGSKPCAGSPGAAACACNTTPSATCSPGGAFQSGYACSGAQRLQCSTDANGCQTSAAPTSCTAPQTCTGALPSAACTCPAGYNPPECDAAGETNGSRCVGTTLTTCTNAGAGCQQLATQTCAANQLCVGAYPSSRCADEEKKGLPGASGGAETWSSLLIGNKINVPVAATLRRFGIVWAGNGAGAALSRTVTFALYKDNGTGPNGALLASAIDRTVNALGAVEFNLTNPAGGLTLAAGDYWVFVNINSPGYVTRNTSPSTPYLYTAATYGGALPATVTTASFMSGSLAGPLGFFLVVIPQQ